MIKLTLVGYTPNGGTRVTCNGASQEVSIPADSLLCFVSVEVGTTATDMYVKCALDATATTTSYIYVTDLTPQPVYLNGATTLNLLGETGVFANVAFYKA